MSERKLENVCKTIWKKVISKSELGEDEIYSLWDGVVQEYDEARSEFSPAYDRLLTKLDSMWSYKNVEQYSSTQAFLYGSVWGGLNVLRISKKKHKAALETTELAYQYRRDQYYNFLDTIYSEPGIMHKKLAKRCRVSPSRMSQITLAATRDGLICAKRSGRDKYYYLLNKGENVYFKVREMNRPREKSQVLSSVYCLRNDMDYDNDVIVNWIKESLPKERWQYAVLAIPFVGNTSDRLEENSREIETWKQNRIELSNNYSSFSQLQAAPYLQRQLMHTT